ncbi:uncharacterized protein N7479_006261 [Penicillium vulpinum]|uniref:Methyltransferase type 12 domain-containing protein n=1 Tax=Penicillium vulpinum TaxID=29845 RepID=A0A1V6R7U5_9EURO|nr:uncharacterized protein N7479_006261 [Penicillium vulpinum]KAJ5959111.1 hypothetical protein N7479_006261 [Penicillium vulpinum]OQD97256.1 hypothetical protein PENVUL_c085G08971 [Penicillium vulpinum]
MTLEDGYVLGRAIEDSVRLDAQHLLWKLHSGFELHPDIPIQEDMKIADLGTGTGIWIFDLAAQLPTVQIHGFDISDSQFPSKELWPRNITLGLLNSLVDPPSSLHGQYDVVHLRMWASNLRGKDISSLSRHIKHLLKPGGYLQWEEADLVHQHIKGVKAEDFERNINEIFKRANLDYSWASNLPGHLQEDFNILQSETGRFKPELVQLCTNTYLMALREILHGIKRPLAHDMLVSTKQEVALYQLQNTKSCIYNWSPVVILAQKK